MSETAVEIEIEILWCLNDKCNTQLRAEWVDDGSDNYDRAFICPKCSVGNFHHDSLDPESATFHDLKDFYRERILGNTSESQMSYNWGSGVGNRLSPEKLEQRVQSFMSCTLWPWSVREATTEEIAQDQAEYEQYQKEQDERWKRFATKET